MTTTWPCSRATEPGPEWPGHVPGPERPGHVKSILSTLEWELTLGLQLFPLKARLHSMTLDWAKPSERHWVWAPADPSMDIPGPRATPEASTKMQCRATSRRDRNRAQRKAALAPSGQGSGRSPLWPQVATQGTAGKEEERCACPGTGKESTWCWWNQVENKVQKGWGQTLRSFKPCRNVSGAIRRWKSWKAFKQMGS